MNGSLYLQPQSPYSDYSDLNALQGLLSDLQFIQNPPQTASGPSAAKDFFLCGEQFPQLVTFMGCSPHLVFTPPADGSDKFCHIKIHFFEQPRILTGQQTAPPRCPGCRFRISEWKVPVNEWRQDNEQIDWVCPGCQETCKLFDWDFRQSGGSGRLFIEVKNIFPGEAVPVDKLLNQLKQLTGESWQYFYLV